VEGKVAIVGIYKKCTGASNKQALNLMRPANRIATVNVYNEIPESRWFLVS